MSDIQTRALEAFPHWLKALSDDLVALHRVLDCRDERQEIRRAAAGGINYFFKSLDLIPDGIDDIGYLDDAFIIRLAAKSIMNADPAHIDDDARSRLNQLREDTGLMYELLGNDLFLRLEKYANALSHGAVRGRTVDEMLSDDEVAGQVSIDVADFANTYGAPAFSNDPKNLIKLKAFLDAKLPQ
ncbi:MAG: YkvA family protein [Proteobacteria bacterium]|nr:YkvA family protein [Pseudomonadota bacterium]